MGSLQLLHTLVLKQQNIAQKIIFQLFGHTDRDILFGLNNSSTNNRVKISKYTESLFSPH